MATKKEDPRLKNVLLICSTVIALASLGLNIVQYKSALQIQNFQLMSEYPTVNTFRLQLSSENIRNIQDLIQQGIEFSYITNPSFIIDKTIYNRYGDEFVIEFLVVANNGDVALSDVKFFGDNSNVPVYVASQLAPHSTILVPEKIFIPAQGGERLATILKLSYNVRMGGNNIRSSLDIPPQSDEIIIFEIGLGPLSQSSFDFEK